MQRLMRALQRAGERYAATPEAERVYRVDEAIKHLVLYVVISIAIGARSCDTRLIATLPPLLEPFAPLSPVLHAIWQNAIATVEVHHRKLEPRARRWLRGLRAARRLNGGELAHVGAIRNAIAYGLGTVEALMGMQSVERWAALLDRRSAPARQRDVPAQACVPAARRLRGRRALPAQGRAARGAGDDAPDVHEPR